jgi:hypothetical protein
MKFFERKRYPQIPESKELAPGVKAVNKKVSGYYGVEESALMDDLMNPGVWRFISTGCWNDSLIRLYSAFGCKRYSSASSVLRDLRDGFARTGDFEGAISG